MLHMKENIYKKSINAYQPVIKKEKFLLSLVKIHLDIGGGAMRLG